MKIKKKRLIALILSGMICVCLPLHVAAADISSETGEVTAETANRAEIIPQIVETESGRQTTGSGITEETGLPAVEDGNGGNPAQDPADNGNEENPVQDPADNGNGENPVQNPADNGNLEESGQQADEAGNADETGQLSEETAVTPEEESVKAPETDEPAAASEMPEDGSIDFLQQTENIQGIPGEGTEPAGSEQTVSELKTAGQTGTEQTTTEQAAIEQMPGQGEELLISDDEPAQLRGFAPVSEDSTGGFVTRMYSIVLGRNPDQSGYDHWVTNLDNGTLVAADIVVRFFFSEEYQKKGKSAGDIVTDMYMAMMNRMPDSGGYDHWVSRLNIGMTPRAIIRSFVGSPEFNGLCGKYGIRPGTVTVTSARDCNYELTYFVYRLYKNCLGRTPDAAGQEHWCQALLDGRGGTQVAYGFIFSKEYKGAHTSNEEYTEMLYRTIMGRASDSAGKAHWVTQLNYTNTREHVLNSFMFSPEFKGQCSRAGIAVGNRIAEPDGGTAWQYNVEILRLCNEQRVRYGLEMLTTREDLWQDVAMVRAAELPAYFSHDRPDGRSCWTAYYEAGIMYTGASENISAGRSGPEEVVNAWMNSEGHRANILRSSSRLLATGYCYSDNSRYKRYYCQNFMR